MIMQKWQGHMQNVVWSRLRDRRGQALPWAMLFLVGVLLFLFIGGIGLGEDWMGRTALQAAADAGAVAATDTAVPTGTVAVKTQLVNCTRVTTSVKPLRTRVHCIPGPVVISNYSGSLPSLLNGTTPGWAVDSGCRNAVEPTTATTPGSYGPYCISVHGQGGGGWQYPSVYTAEAAADAAINANLGNLYPIGSVTMVSFDAVDGSGQVTLVLRLDETNNAITRMVHHPVTTEAEGVATPTALGG